PDETQVAPIALEHIEQKRHRDGREREKQQQANDHHRVAVPVSARRAVARGVSRARGHQAATGFQPLNADGTSASAANVVTSKASGRASSARASALLSACPDLNAVYCPTSGWPSRYRSPIASSTLCFTNSLS